jgi:hypothetical protein
LHTDACVSHAHPYMHSSRSLIAHRVVTIRCRHQPITDSQGHKTRKIMVWTQGTGACRSLSHPNAMHTWGVSPRQSTPRSVVHRWYLTHYGCISIRRDATAPEPFWWGCGRASTHLPFIVHPESPIAKSVISSCTARHSPMVHRTHIVRWTTDTGKLIHSSPQGSASQVAVGLHHPSVVDGVLPMRPSAIMCMMHRYYDTYHTFHAIWAWHKSHDWWRGRHHEREPVWWGEGLPIGT